MTDATRAGCSRCQTVRTFLTVSAALIAAIYMQPSWALLIARQMPDPLWLGCGLVFISTVIFFVRLRQALPQMRPGRPSENADVTLS